jgi:RHS repeat-associated protein
VVIETTSAPASAETIYLLHDHLGSTDVITTADGTVQTRYSFDAWGRRRDVTWAAFFPTVPASLWQTAKTTRGFTGHEQLDEVGLVHMNGRVYDPQLGRFLSADPVVQDATDLQAYNHYAYVRNNPLSLLDPSGFSWIGDVFKSIGNFFSSVFRGIGNALKALLKNSLVRSVIQIAACIGLPGIGCDIAAAAMALAGGGSIKQALLAFAFADISQFVWTNVGAMLKAEGVAGNFLVKGLVHGTVGGAPSVAQGGSFMQGFAAAAIGASTGLMSNAISGGNVILDTAIVGAAGGVASVLTGGKFEAGFVTATFANLFNKWAVLGQGKYTNSDANDYVNALRGNGNGFFEGTWEFVEAQDKIYTVVITDAAWLKSFGGEYFTPYDGGRLYLNPELAGTKDYKTMDGGWYQQDYLAIVSRGVV